MKSMSVRFKRNSMTTGNVTCFLDTITTYCIKFEVKIYLKNRVL